MRKFLSKIKCFFEKTSKVCIHDLKEITSTDRSGKPICATIICVKCKKTIIK